jgi:hypothetical protein
LRVSVVTGLSSPSFVEVTVFVVWVVFVVLVALTASPLGDEEEEAGAEAVASAWFSLTAGSGKVSSPRSFTILRAAFR